jgi:serine/threonine protein kinase
MVGQSLANGKFRITRLLGHGGMGAVYEAIQVAMNRRVALKLIPTHDAKTVARFKREAMTISQLRHPNTVTVFDYGETPEGYLYLAMELLDGRTLGEVIRTEAPMAPRRALYIAAQICRSLNEAHMAGIVHRDIKPDNIMLIRVDQDFDFVKVLDFGIAKAVQEDEINLTGDGRIVGTPRYMSPEQISGFDVDGRTDIYSLGCIVFEMLSGSPPFKQSTTTALLIAHTQQMPPSFAERLGQAASVIPPMMESLIRKTLEKDPRHRPPSADYLRGEFERLMTSLPVVPAGIFGEEDENDCTAQIVVTEEVLQEDPSFSSLDSAELVLDRGVMRSDASSSQNVMAYAPQPYPGAPWGAQTPANSTNPEFSSVFAPPPPANDDKPVNWAVIAVGLGVVCLIVLGAMAYIKSEHERRMAEAEAHATELAEKLRLQQKRREEIAAEEARLEAERLEEQRIELEKLAKQAESEPRVVPRVVESDSVDLNKVTFDVNPEDVEFGTRTRMVEGAVTDLLKNLTKCEGKDCDPDQSKKFNKTLKDTGEHMRKGKGRVVIE